MHHEALRLQQDEKFEIIPMFQPKDINSYLDPSRNQVFVFDDCFGETHLDRVLVEKFDSPLRLLSTKSVEQEEDFVCKTIDNKTPPTLTQSKYIGPRTILLMTSRLHIYNEILRLNPLGSLDVCVCDLTSNDNCLDEIDCLRLLEQYIP